MARGVVGPSLHRGGLLRADRSRGRRSTAAACRAFQSQQRTFWTLTSGTGYMSSGGAERCLFCLIDHPRVLPPEMQKVSNE
eukprot:COSAG01_NODE_702_length_14141_cov_36.742739_3_plen_81_part_00